MPKNLNTKRISIMIGEEQHQEILRRGANLSALIRDLVSDYLSEHKVTLTVSRKTYELYEEVIAKSGYDDSDIEPYLVKALKDLLHRKIQEMQQLERQLNEET